ncbi:PspA/IM30 family protein [Paenibacillus ihbetae]|uniref:Phage shock protein A n=1 Tax=Paenibacillus ihbetae TaxID=1870820 RepID=A0ABX3JR25_9BACL|nr:PspA/IM30 family protein [Paenibacillus ihbetae]OOC59290.1 phage shock protein A [Paenibacillus ihbetae]
MGMLSRFTDIMRANVNALLDRSDDPEKTIDEYMRSLHSDLGQVKAETSSLLAEERRAKRALDERITEVAKLQRYAEKAAEAGNEADARKFLERKAEAAVKLDDLQQAYEQAASDAASMKQIQDKLAADMERLEARRRELKGKMAEARHQQRLSESGSSRGDVGGAFQSMEEKANRALDEALALAELRAGSKKEDDLDELMAELEEQMKRRSDDSQAAANPEAAPDDRSDRSKQKE